MNDKDTIVFTDSISVESVQKFMASILAIHRQNPNLNELKIVLSSPGGNVELAFELYNFIKALGCKVIMYNTSYVSSAAVVLFLAGDERICMPFSSFYLHPVSKKFNSSLNIKDLERELKEMRMSYKKIVELLERSTYRSKIFWRRLMAKGTVILPHKALEYGLITQLIKNA